MKQCIRKVLSPWWGGGGTEVAEKDLKEISNSLEVAKIKDKSYALQISDQNCIATLRQKY